LATANVLFAGTPFVHPFRSTPVHRAGVNSPLPATYNVVPSDALKQSQSRPPLPDSGIKIAPTNNNGNGYAGLDFNQSGGFVPPDSCGAAGPSKYVETVNQTIAIYSPKDTGAAVVTDGFDHFFFTVGGRSHASGGSGLSDPIVVYDELIGRFIVGDQDVDFNTHVSNFVIAVSKSSSPATLTTADWVFYTISTTEANFDADYPGNFGYNADALVFTLNMFAVSGSNNHVLVTSVNTADLAAGVTQASLHVFKNDVANFSVRPATMHGSVTGDPMWLVTEHGNNFSIDVLKMTNVLSASPSFTTTNLVVSSYGDISVAYPLNPDGSVITTTIDSRVLKAAVANKKLVATHHIAVSTTEAAARWYVIDISGANPVLSDQGQVTAGSRTYSFYPGIDINSSGQIGMSYMRSGTNNATDFMSMYVTGRVPSDLAGTMEASAPVPAGAGKANYSDFIGGRAGDLSGINIDPVDGSFWAVNEYANKEANANWGTAIANFTPSGTTHLVVSAPSSATAGSAISFTVTAKDASNNTVPLYGGTVHFTSTDGQAVLPADYTFQNLNPGFVTLSATLKTTGSQTITATDTTNTSITGTSNSVTVSAANATHYTVSAPASATAGTAFNFTITAQDQFNNTATGYTGTVHFTSSDVQAVLPADNMLTNGTGTFSAILKTAGNQTIRATDTANSTITGTSNAINVSALAATHFTVLTPGNVTAGATFNFTVTALDQFNNTATTYGGTVHFTSSDGAAVLPADSTLSSGTGTFSATLKTAGNQTITATDTVTSSIAGTSGPVSISAASATHFMLSAPASATAGTAFSFTLTAQDQFNNTVTSYPGMVHFTSSDGQAVLPSNNPLTNGTGTFSATLKTKGNQTITGNDASNSSVIGTSNSINVAAANTSKFVVSAPASTTAGSAFNFTVTALDAFGNTTTSYAGNVHFTSSDGQATLPANNPLTNGTGSFSATLKTTGSQTISATDSVTSSITGTSGSIAVSAAPTPTPTPTATPTATPPRALNISTRLRVDVGDKVMIGGFIITGNTPKAVVLRGLGPSLANFGLPAASLLSDPLIELYGSGGLIVSNDNWKDSPQKDQIQGTIFQPSDDRESVILATLPPAAYSVVLKGANGGAGIGVVEVYDNNTAADSELANISTRGFVQTGDNVMIGGFTLGGPNNPTNIAVRALGPSLSVFGLTNLLTDPTLELHNANGTLMLSNDDWQSDPVSAAQLTANGLAPSNPKEAAIFASVAPPGQFTVVVAGKSGGVGIALVEIYNLR